VIVMMGTRKRSFAPLVKVCLEDLVPADHFYRHLERTLDLSFVREFVQKSYADGGRPSIDPVVFFKLQLVMFFEGIRSERQLMRHAADRLSIRWYLGVRHVTQGSIPSKTERTRRRFFGSRAYLAPKGNGNNSMLVKQDVAKAL
jgi:transposase